MLKTEKEIKILNAGEEEEEFPTRGYGWWVRSVGRQTQKRNGERKKDQCESVTRSGKEGTKGE